MNSEEQLTAFERRLAKPKLFEKCVAAYALMENHAIKVHEGLVYQGSLTQQLADEADISPGAYSHVLGKLRAMDCVRQLERGGGAKGSQWLLIEKPTLAVFNKVPHQPISQKHGKNAQHQQIRDLGSRVTALESQVRYLMNKAQEETNG